MNIERPNPDPRKVPDGTIEVDGNTYYRDNRGSLIPAELVKPQHKLEDQTVRKIIGFGKDLNAEIGRFKGHTMLDVSTFLGLLAERYGDTKRGLAGKGNVTLRTVDNCARVRIKCDDQLTFGSELKTASDLVQECIRKWSADMRPEARAIISRAFNTDKEGQVSRTAIFGLLALEIDDPVWLQAMQAVKDSIRVDGVKVYIQMQERRQDGTWDTITVDLASAVVPDDMTSTHLPDTATSAASDIEAAE